MPNYSRKISAVKCLMKNVPDLRGKTRSRLKAFVRLELGFFFRETGSVEELLHKAEQVRLLDVTNVALKLPACKLEIRCVDFKSHIGHPKLQACEGSTSRAHEWVHDELHS